MKAPRVPSFNERDLSDKPKFMRRTPLLDRRQVINTDRRYRCTLQSLYGLDRGIGRLIAQLREADELDDTAFFFLTDNGYFFGEHRFKAGKSRPFEESIRTPMVVSLPSRSGAPAGVVSDAPVASIDIAPTILDLADAEPCTPDGSTCRELDGRSLIGPVLGEESAFEDRGILVELATNRRFAPSGSSCAFTAIRTTAHAYVEDSEIPEGPANRCSDERSLELYDLGRDPFELENTAAVGPNRSPTQTDLAERLRSLRDCAGIEGRDPASARPFCE